MASHVKRETGHTHKHTIRTTPHNTRHDKNNTTNDHTQNNPPAFRNDWRWLVTWNVVGCKIPRKENSPMFRSFSRPPVPVSPGSPEVDPTIDKNKRPEFKELCWLKLIAGFTPKKASTRRVNRKIANFTRNQRVFFSRYLAANYGYYRVGPPIMWIGWTGPMLGLTRDRRWCGLQLTRVNPTGVTRSHTICGLCVPRSRVSLVSRCIPVAIYIYSLGIPLYPCSYLYLQQLSAAGPLYPAVCCIPLYPAVSVRIGRSSAS